MSAARISRNDPCPCGSGKKFKHCCYAKSFDDGVPQPRPVPSDGVFLRRGPEQARRLPPQLKPVTRVAVEYSIADAMGKAEVSFCYPLGTRIIMADGNVLPVGWLKPGMQFRLEDGGVATTTKVEAPKVWQPPSQECDANGNSLRRVIGTVKYSGYYPRMDFGVPGDVIETTPGHLFYSMTRRDWFPLETFRQGERLRNDQGQTVPIEWISPRRWEFGDLNNIEVEEYYTYFVGGGSSCGIWTHNGMNMGCRVPRAAVEEALENGVVNKTSKRLAGVTKPPDHHLFPQELRAEFAKRGFNDIDRFLVRLHQGVHEALHYKQASDVLKGGFWNNEFLRRMSAQEAISGQLNRREILRIGAQMRRDYVPGVKLLPPGGR